MQDYLFGYGSLISHDSRLTHSDIDVDTLPVHVAGWRRGWSMASTTEFLTCVGAKQAPSNLPTAEVAGINGVLVPIEEISENLVQREQHYRFVQLSSEQIQVWHDHHLEQLDAWLLEARVWICEVEQWQEPSAQQPICQTYVDTCLSGCIEHVDAEFAKHFVQSTCNWQRHWINDRAAPQYPRLASVSKQMQQQIDELLRDLQLLPFRKEKP